MILLCEKRAEAVLVTPSPALTTTRKDRAMAGSLSMLEPFERHPTKGARLYRIWKGMRNRVFNPNSEAFAHYGGRGVGIAQEWNNYLVFRSWALANGYRGDLTLDRIDNDGSYGPDNCRWVDRVAQARNKRVNRVVTYKGKKACLAEHAEDAGLRYIPVHQRITILGWSVERALETPIAKCRRR